MVGLQDRVDLAPSGEIMRIYICDEVRGVRQVTSIMIRATGRDRVSKYITHVAKLDTINATDGSAIKPHGSYDVCRYYLKGN